jgi:hypothetical protein
MSLLCALGGHEARPGETYNGGYYFSRCRRCRRDMVRNGASWRLVPGGYHVVWRAGRHSHAIEPDYAAVVPILHHLANLPAVRPRFASWSRHLVRGRRANVSNAAAAVVEDEEAPYPRLLVFAALVGAGLQLLLGFGSGRAA